MTLRGIFKFYGREEAIDHMPRPYHVYLVYSSPHPNRADYSIASIMISATSTPLPPQVQYAIDKNAEGALEYVFNILSNMPENQGLEHIRNIESVSSGRD